MISVSKAAVLFARSLAFGLLLFCATSNAQDRNRFSVFVNRPIEASYETIAKSPLSVLAQDWRRFQRNYKEWVALLKLVESGNPLGVDLAVKLLPSTDGGNLGDLCRAVSANIRSDPKLVIGAVHRHAISPVGFESILTCLPLDTVDNFHAKIAETNARLAAVSRVDDPRLAEYRSVAIKIYEARLVTFKGALEGEKKGSAPGDRQGAKW